MRLWPCILPFFLHAVSMHKTVAEPTELYLSSDLYLEAFSGRITTCAQNMVTVSDECACDVGFAPAGNICSACAEGTYKSVAGNVSCVGCLSLIHI